MLAKFVPSDAQNKLEFDLMQCDNINQYFAHLKDDNTKLVPDAFVIGGLTSKPFGFKVKDTNGNKTDAFEKVRQVLDQLPFSLKNWYASLLGVFLKSFLIFSRSLFSLLT